MWCDYAEIRKKLYRGVDKLDTVRGLLDLTAELGDKTWMVDAVTGREYGYAESNLTANRVANALKGLGHKKGDRVGFFMANSPRCVLTILGIMKGGMIAVPMNPNFRDAEVDYLSRRAEIATIVVDPDPGHIKILTDVLRVNGVLRNIVCYGETDGPANGDGRLTGMNGLLGSATDSDPGIAVGGDDPCAIFFTSGTTGMPKGAPVTNRIYLLAAQSVLAIPLTHGGTRNYTALPLSHANAQLYSMTAMRCLGASWVLSDRFSPTKFFQEIKRHEATYFNSIGGMMQILDAAFDGKPVPEHTARYVFVGGTPRALWERFEKKFGVTIFEGYSQSESPVLFLNANPDPARRKLGSFGIPVFPDLGRRTAIRIDTGADAPEGQDATGELIQIGFNMKGYWEEEEKSKEVFEDGWLHSGDVITRDRDGFHFFVDRMKFMIRKGGENISAFEVEAAVNSYPNVSESSAVPVPDPLREEEIKIFVKPVEGATVDPAGLIAHCAGRLAYFKVPRYVEMVTSFPKTATERIQKMELKERERNRKEFGWDRDKEIPDWRERYCR
jgi:crotonobetaine/carnitine-CoA ligase